MVEAGGSRTIGSVTTGILVLALLYFAQSIFAPLIFSLLTIALVWPIQAALQRWLPKLLALLITLVATMIVIVAIGSSVAWGFGKLAQWLFVNADRFQAIYVDWTTWLEGHGVAVAGPLADRFDVTWLVRFVQGMAGRVNSFAGFALLVFIFIMLGLLEVEDFNARILLPAAQPYGMRILVANRVIGAKLRRFMIVRTFASILTGLVVWLFALGAGLELAAAWGAIAFALNYIPFLGPFVATALPTLFAIAQFELVADCGCHLCEPQRHPIHHRQLPGAEADGSFAGNIPVCRYFRGVFLEFHVGHRGCLHRRADADSVHCLLRGHAVGKVDRDIAVEQFKGRDEQ